LMMGSDYCFPIAYEQPVEIVTSISLEPEQELAILEGNAKRLLKINNK
jgi:predicted TIM-barrel fold metal-dependent hydrolase